MVAKGDYMTPREISVHQYNEGTRVGDATTNAMLLVQEFLTDFGFKSEVFAASVDPDLSSRIRHLSELRPGSDDLLLIHHGWFHTLYDQLAALRCRKALVYHSITPPKLLRNDQLAVRYSLEAFHQITKFRDCIESSIAMSSYSARQLRQRGYENVTVIPFLKDFPGVRYAPHRKAPYYDRSGVFRVLFVGRISPHKCQHQLVEFVNEVRSIHNAPVELVLVGHSEHGREYKAQIDRYIRDHELADCVVMTDSISDDELMGHYRAANAYVSLSEHEGFGVPLIEAMALDLPVIAYAAGGIPDAMGDAGILIRDKAPSTVLGHLRRLHEDRSFRSDLIRKQRQRVRWYGREHIESELQRWLEGIGAFDEPPKFGRASRWRSKATTDRPEAGDGQGSFETPPIHTSEPSGKIHYVLEGPFETSYSLAYNNRQIALSLDQRRDRVAYLEPAEGVEHWSVDIEAANRLPEVFKDLVRPPPVTGERIVTIRHMYPHRPNGMLGDLRLYHFPWEESAIPPSLAGLMNLHLDGVLVASQFVKRVLRNSGVRLPIAVIGHGIDALPAERVTDRRSGRGPVTASTPFTFLHISSGLPRKGIEELITAYCLAFSSSDPVLLVIKTFDNEQNVVGSWVERIAGGGSAPAIQVIAEELDQWQMELIYDTADAMVLPTRGEAFNFPAAEAMARGIPVIVTGFGGHLEFCDADNAALVDYKFELSTSHLEVANSLWVRASVPHLIEAMKAVHQDGRAPDTATALRARRGQSVALQLRWPDVAERIDNFVAYLDERSVMTRKIRLAWVSTYNVVCGLATHSEQLLEFFDRDIFEITIIGNNQQPTRPDPPNMVRLWSNHNGTLDDVRNYILQNNFDAAFFNFHFALMDLNSLANTLSSLHAAGIDTYLTLHKTIDEPRDGSFVSLREIADALGASTRLIVHALSDIERLKTFELTDNVVLLPPGVADGPSLHVGTARSLLGIQSFNPIIGTFGFVTPLKGLRELIHGFALTLRRYPRALLLMLNAEFPVAESREEHEHCLTLIRELGIEDSVHFINDFLDLNEMQFLLSACDAIIFAYQHSNESASGAIRVGLAAGRPVGTTPLPIFAELSELVYQFSGFGAADIADGIKAMLDQQCPKEEMARKQRAWVQDNSWAQQAARIGNMMRGCFEERHGVELRPPRAPAAGLANGECVRRAPPEAGSSLRDMIEAEIMALSKRDFIGLAFRRTLGRDPTSDEVRDCENINADAATAAGRWRIIKEISKLADRPDNPGTFRSEVSDVGWLLHLDNQAFIEAAYRALLRREADTAGKERYLTALENRELSKRQVIDALLASQEFRQLDRPLPEISKPADTPGNLGNFRSEVYDATALLDLDNRAFIDGAYRALLLREADAVGKERYLTALENGELSKRQIIDALLASQEFRQLGRPLRVLHGDGPPAPAASRDITTSIPAAAGDRRDELQS
jgi:glycosyltransferase involved in cell wall biosynthesis